MNKIKLNSYYDNDKVKDLISKHMNKPFDEIDGEEFRTTALLWYTMFIEFVENNGKNDDNFELMKLQTILKSHLWVDK